jgi:hypothetical protein
MCEINNSAGRTLVLTISTMGCFVVFREEKNKNLEYPSGSVIIAFLTSEFAW